MRDMTLSTLDRVQAEAAAGEWARSMDEDVFRAFYERTARPLWAYLSRTTGSPQAADDLLQEAYYRLVRSRMVFDDEAHRRHYLFKIAANLVRDAARRPPVQHVPVEEELPARTPDQATVTEERDRLAHAMAGLGARERSLLWLAYAQGASHEEIARALGLRPGSIRVLLWRARRRIAALLRAHDEAVSPGGRR